MLQQRSRYRRAALSLASLGAGMALLVGVLPGVAEAQTHVPRNPKCADLGYPNSFKIDVENPPAGTYTAASSGVETVGNAAGFEVTISYSNFPVFDFSTNIAVDAVLVKAGPGANLYEYDPATMSGSGLTSPNGNSISHIDFCWGDGGNGGNGGTTTTVPGEEPPGEEPPGEERPGEEPTTPDGPRPGEPAPPVAGAPSFTG